MSRSSGAPKDRLRGTNGGGGRRPGRFAAVMAGAALAAGALAVGAGHFLPAQPSLACPSLLECDTLAVRLAPGDERTVDLRYAVYGATDPSRAALLVLVGGPGVSGIDEADRILAALPPAMLHQFRLVFVDHRGVGGSSEIQCPTATNQLGRARNDAVGSDALRWAEIGRAFGRDCVAEAGIAGVAMGEFSSERIASDLEAPRPTRTSEPRFDPRPSRA